MKVLKGALLALAAPGLICLAQSADQQDVAAILKRHYVDQALILRLAVDKNKQVYDAAGTLLSGGKDGPWTVYAGVMPKKIALSARELRIEGYRLEFAFDAREQALTPYKSKQHIQLVVGLAEPLTTIDQAEAILAKVFALTDDDVIASVPEIWKPYLKRRAALKKNPSLASAEADLLQRPARPKPMSQAEMEELGVTAPKAISTPEPSYSSFAKDHKFQGTVVLTATIDEAGKVLNPYIARPAGMGLDEQAIEAMKVWRFKPGTKNGRPVPVEISLEIQFNLY
jgi:TonB family protein